MDCFEMKHILVVQKALTFFTKIMIFFSSGSMEFYC